jgi:hypothetical protein
MKLISKTKPSVYLPGKIGPYDWRHSIVPNLRGAGALGGHYPPPLDCGSYVYTGPFFASDDHSGTHGATCHGNCEGQLGEPPISRERLFHRNNAAIRTADLIVAYIDAYDCIGTICEVSYAWTLGKKIKLIFAPTINRNEFWYLAQMGQTVRVRKGEPLTVTFKRIIAEVSR